jgi:formylglycine-generating enzyme required for sulfatase activity
MALDAITRDRVREALRAIRYANPVPDSALLDLDLVSCRLRAEDLADTRHARSWVLGQCIADAVEVQLRRLRGPQPGPAATPLTPEAELAELQQDLRSGSAERLDWALVHWRYLSPTHQPVPRVSRALGVTERTLQNRVTRGVAALVVVLQQSEVEAARSLETDAGAVAAERVIVDEGAAPRGVVEILGELQALAGRHRQTVRISPDQLEAAARYPAAELVAYRLGRIAEWSLPRYRLDSRFVDLSLLVDLGEESQSGRWQARTERFADLRKVLAAVGEPAVVLLGPPGSGKSTLLGRLELDLSRDALGPGDPESAAPLTFFISLNQYRPAAPGAPLPAPADWLAERWATRFPKLPPLPEVARERPVVYLLDGLNEMPHRSPEEYRARIILWKQFLLESVTSGSGHRAVIACRSLDYSAPLSTPAQRVPQVQLEPLDNAKVEAFLRRYSPGNAPRLWEELRQTAMLGALRWPFFLRLVVEADDADDAGNGGALPEGLAALFTGLVRRALLREVERDNPRFAPGVLFSARDYERAVSGKGWRTSYELPDGGTLFGALAGLAYGMQAEAVTGESSQARVGYEAALGMLPAGQAEDIVRAGTALGVVDVDQAANELQFSHQLMQEYFAGRALAAAPDPERVRVEWRAARITPGVRELIEPEPETLSPLPTTGWEETTLMAAAMIEQPEQFLRDLMPHNLALAGKAANLPVLRSRLSAPFLDKLRWALVARSRDPEADLRARIDAGLALGPLGDPRFERRTGPHGEYLLPPMVEIPGGVYPIGDDKPVEQYGVLWSDHMPCHTVELAPFAIGRFPVTNAEWACFMAAGGYEDEQWWETPDALAWQRGENTHAGKRATIRYYWQHYREHPEELEDPWDDDEAFDRWLMRIAMTEAEFDAYLKERYADQKFRSPDFWNDDRFNNPSQPVVGVCWYEARAYCAWLSKQAGDGYRLPSEVEHEAAQGGFQGRRWAFGNEWDSLRANTAELRLKRTNPVGVLAEGDTPEGASDLGGNVSEYTASLWGKDRDHAEYRYPYVAGDGREEATAGADILRVYRGGVWNLRQQFVLAVNRDGMVPDGRMDNIGFRLCCTRG